MQGWSEGNNSTPCENGAIKWFCDDYSEPAGNIDMGITILIMLAIILIFNYFFDKEDC